jgi:cob(I)alamin adenosyltransferase
MQNVNGRKNSKTKPQKKYHINNTGLTIVYYGDGKGKTTAALGAVLRAMGEGWKCAVYQFIKGPWPSAERETIKKYLPKLATIEAGGKGFVGIMGDKLAKEDHKTQAKKLFEKVLKETKKDLNLIVLDEILDAVELGFIKEKEVINLIKEKSASTHIIITGHKKYSKILTVADLVTEMKKIKHPFDKGFLAIKGLDY